MARYIVAINVFLFATGCLYWQGADGATSDWVKLNTRNQQVCFETKGGVFGSFDNYVKGGLIAAIKLVHLSGRVRCASHAKYNSRWGCTGFPSLLDNPLNVFVTDQHNRIIFPRKELIVPKQHVHSAGKWYGLPFTDANSSTELIFTEFAHPFYFPKNKQMRIWYGEDLTGYAESDNSGRVCVDVYAKFLK